MLTKFCQCGCGKPTRPAPFTRKNRGWIKGQPLRFINGHNKANLWRGPVQERFERFFDKTPNACWIWKGGKTPKGYGVFGHHPKKAHRLSYEIYKGSIPNGKCICHSCDNPPCVNPEHLFVGSHKDNAQDRNMKGRNYVLSGRRHPLAKLTEQDIINIRNDKRIYKEIAQSYKVSISLISWIKLKKGWKHIS